MRPAAALAACAFLGACAGAGTPSPQPSGTVVGYLTQAEIEALAAQAGTWRDRGDGAASEALRALEDTDRWWLATTQAEIRPPEAAQHFDCVLGTRMSARPRPALTRIMTRLLVDSATLTARLAASNPRPRPVAVDPSRRACQRITDEERAGASWPAAAGVAGAAYGELLAALAPDRAEAARAMGREIGNSRAVCAMNWPSDIEDGLRLGREVYEQAATTPGFEAELEAARLELAAARREGLTSPACAAERRALGPRFPRPGGG
ncbi:PA-phosphatase [Brevundimonas sp.]|uniref:PA-phosphatase n=1 Tax=Brevundimonas sp. TaxID=1871086 RepID=UPI002D40D4B3|nr:PA-phosphatase [Brevundimonas sp.]HYD26887.1 PA-phosphatase [Brevundimonas sp.]